MNDFLNFNSGWYAFGSLCRSLFLFVRFCSLCLIRIVLMFVGGLCKILRRCWFCAGISMFCLLDFFFHPISDLCFFAGRLVFQFGPLCRTLAVWWLFYKLNIHPNLNYLHCTEKFIIITTSTANSLHGITTSIKWNQPSRCFRWRQQLLLPNLEKQLETTPQPSPTVVEVIYSLCNPQIKQAEYQITRGWKWYSGNQEERSQMLAGKSKRVIK